MMSMGNLTAKMKRARIALEDIGPSITMLERQDSSETVTEAPPPLKTIKPSMTYACANLWLFREMPEKALHALVGRCQKEKHKAGKTIIEQGDSVTSKSEMHVVLSGTVRLLAAGGDGFEGKAESGSMFGHTALIFQGSRSASAISGGAVTLALTLGNLQRFLPVMPNARLLMFMRSQMVLQSLTDYQLEDLAENVECREHLIGEILIEEGAPGHDMFLVRKGKLEVLVRGEAVTAVGRGSVLGQRALNGKLRTATCRAQTAASTVVISDALLTRVHNPVLQRVLACDAVVAVQQHARVFGSFNSVELADVLRSLEETTFSQGELVLQCGQVMQELFVVRDGLVDGAAVLDAGGFQYFGSISGQPCISDVRVVSKAAAVIKCSRDRWMSILEQRRPTQELTIDSLELKRELGTGESGKVRLAHQKSDANTLVAVKIVAKASRAFMDGRVLTESLIMQSLSHPFCVRLFSVTEDQTNFYLIMEYVSGGELFARLVELNRFSESVTKFYVACVVLALEYLHRNGIVYRDLKPENLLLDEKGYIKVTDFGYAKRIHNRRTFTMCGTPEYQAPEIMTVDMGATTTADYWSLGVLTYEMLTGNSPFLSKPGRTALKASDPWVIIRNARTGRYPPPSGYAGTAVSDFISRLLQVNPANRMASAGEVKQHPWFAGFDWKGLEKRRLPAPGKHHRGR